MDEAFLNAYILNEKFGFKKMRFVAFKLEIIKYHYRKSVT